ncbi:DNA ligase 1, partial [Tanacetum coccineum]
MGLSYGLALEIPVLLHPFMQLIWTLFMQTKLRIGLAEQTLLTALGHAIFYTETHPSPPANTDSPLEEAAKIVKQVYSVIPVYDKIVPALLSGGVWDLPKTCCFSPGVP